MIVERLLENFGSSLAFRLSSGEPVALGSCILTPFLYSVPTI